MAAGGVVPCDVGNLKLISYAEFLRRARIYNEATNITDTTYKAGSPVGEGRRVPAEFVAHYGTDAQWHAAAAAPTMASPLADSAGVQMARD